MFSSTKQPAPPSKNTPQITRDLAAAEQVIQSLQAQVEQLTRQLAWFQREVFGPKSERREGDGNPRQLNLGEAFDCLPEDLPAPLPEKPSPAKKKNLKKKSNNNVNDSGLRFTEEVEVKEIRLEVPELQGENAQDYEVIGEKIVCRLAARPCSYVVLKYIQPVVKFIGKTTEAKNPSDNNDIKNKEQDNASVEKTTSKALVFSPPMPSTVIEKSYADVSFIAAAMIDKWGYHLPFHRQQQCIAQNGITLCSGYLVQLVQRVVPLLKPIYQALLASVLESDVLAMDETPTKAGHQKKVKNGKKAQGKMKAGYYWPIYGDRNEVVFPFAASRGAHVVTELLKGFTGTLLSDGYSAYESFAKANEKVIHAQCWAHSRRKFIETEDLEPINAGLALAHIRALYAIEEVIREEKLTGKAKQVYRDKYSRPQVDAFFQWNKGEAERIALLPPDDYSKAIHYTLKREAALRVFLNNPDVQIDTNHIERALRVIPMGKKNWLFNWTESGAEAAGIVQSLIVSCKLQGINPYEYLVDVLQRIDRHPAKAVADLIPRNWKTQFSGNPLRSPLWEMDH